MDINSIIDSVISVERVLNRTAEKNKGGLTLKMQVLLAMDKNGGEITNKEIFDQVKIVKTNLAILCNNLCEMGLIEKIKNGTDNRFIKYRLLEKGKAEVTNFLNDGEACFKKILSNKEIAELESASKTIVEILK